MSVHSKTSGLCGLRCLTKHYPSLLFHFGDSRDGGRRKVRNVGRKEVVLDLIPRAITKQDASALIEFAQLKVGSSVGLRAPTSECPTNYSR